MKLSPKSSRKDLLYPLAGIIIFLLVWQLVASFLINKEWLLPTPGAVIVAFGENLPLIWHHSLYTLAEAGLGMILAVIVSLGIALLMALSPAIKKTLYPLLLGSQMVPIIVLAPLFIIWFGYGTLPKVLVVILICFFPMTINILAGLNAADNETLSFYRSMGMNDKQLFRMIRLPLALPHFFSGLRISAVYSVMGARHRRMAWRSGWPGINADPCPKCFQSPVGIRRYFSHHHLERIDFWPGEDR